MRFGWLGSSTKLSYRPAYKLKMNITIYVFRFSFRRLSFSGLRKHKYVSFYERSLNCSGWNAMSFQGGRVKAVLFDLGGTLIRTAEIPRILRRILEANGIKRSLKEISLAHKKIEKQFSLQKYAGPYEEFWIRWNF